MKYLLLILLLIACDQTRERELPKANVTTPCDPTSSKYFEDKQIQTILEIVKQWKREGVKITSLPIPGHLIPKHLHWFPGMEETKGYREATKAMDSIFEISLKLLP